MSFILPEVGLSNPFDSIARVDFPLPVCPIIPVIFPLGKVMFMLSRAVFSKGVPIPYLTVIFSKVIAFSVI
jgi:hypothetical protein